MGVFMPPNAVVDLLTTNTSNAQDPTPYSYKIYTYTLDSAADSSPAERENSFSNMVAYDKFGFYKLSSSNIADTPKFATFSMLKFKGPRKDSTTRFLEWGVDACSQDMKNKVERLFQECLKYDPSSGPSSDNYNVSNGYSYSNNLFDFNPDYYLYGDISGVATGRGSGTDMKVPVIDISYDSAIDTAAIMDTDVIVDSLKQIN